MRWGDTAGAAAQGERPFTGGCEESQFVNVADRVLAHPTKVVELVNDIVQESAGEIGQ